MHHIKADEQSLACGFWPSFEGLRCIGGPDCAIFALEFLRGKEEGSRHSLSVIPGSLSPLFPISARQCVQGRCLSSFFQSKPWYASDLSA